MKTFIYSPSRNGFYLIADQAEYEGSAAGWPDDGIEMTQEQREALYGKQIGLDANGFPVAVEPAAPSSADLIAANVAAIQVRLDSEAKSRGYDNILSACSYAAQVPGAPFQAEGAAFLAWRSTVWAQAYATLAQVQAGAVPMPTPADAVAAMPALLLP
jgi:hypothetical protein